MWFENRELIFHSNEPECVCVCVGFLMNTAACDAAQKTNDSNWGKQKRNILIFLSFPFHSILMFLLLPVLHTHLQVTANFTRSNFHVFCISTLFLTLNTFNDSKKLSCKSLSLFSLDVSPFPFISISISEDIVHCRECYGNFSLLIVRME